MRKLKIFNGSSAEEINNWLKDTNVELITVNRRDIKDYNDAGEYIQTWVETTIIYEES